MVVVIVSVKTDSIMNETPNFRSVVTCVPVSELLYVILRSNNHHWHIPPGPTVRLKIMLLRVGSLDLEWNIEATKQHLIWLKVLLHLHRLGRPHKPRCSIHRFLVACTRSFQEYLHCTDGNMVCLSKPPTCRTNHCS